MTIEAIISHLESLDDVHVQRTDKGDGSPEIAWGDVFLYYSLEGGPAGQPFATITTKDYPGEPASGLDRPGAFRRNVQASKEVAERVGSQRDGDADPAATDVFAPHTTYPGWLTVIEPVGRTLGRPGSCSQPRIPLPLRAMIVARHRR